MDPPKAGVRVKVSETTDHRNQIPDRDKGRGLTPTKGSPVVAETPDLLDDGDVGRVFTVRAG